MANVSIPPVVDRASSIVQNRIFVTDWAGTNVYSTAIDAINALKNVLPTLDVTAVTTWLTNEITNGTTGLPLSIQQDIYDYERERDLLTINESKDRIAADWAKQNWPLPDSVLAAQFTRLELEYDNKKLDKSRDIRVEAEKIAIEQIRFAVGQYITLALGEWGLYEKAAEASAHIAAQIAAGLFSSAHVQASVSFSSSASGSASDSAQSQVSRSENYNHNYEED